jgi:hypothetical protein
MKTRTKHALLALLAGTGITLVLFALSWFAYDRGQTGLSRVLYWQGAALQTLAPRVNVGGTAEHPIYEGTPVDAALYFAGIPLGICVYSLLALVFIRYARRGPKPQLSRS